MDTDSRVQCWLRYLHLPWRHPCFTVNSARWTQKAEHITLPLGWHGSICSEFISGRSQSVCAEKHRVGGIGIGTKWPHLFVCFEFIQEPPACAPNSTKPSFPSFLVEQHFWKHIQTYFKRLSSSYKPFMCLILLSGFIVSLLSVPFGMWRWNSHLCFYSLCLSLPEFSC